MGGGGAPCSLGTTANGKITSLACSAGLYKGMQCSTSSNMHSMLLACRFIQCLGIESIYIYRDYNVSLYSYCILYFVILILTFNYSPSDMNR